MTLLKKIKVNLDYLLGKADPTIYAKPNHSNITSEEWKKRWDIFIYYGDCFVWYGVDSEGNIAQFACDSGYVPEAFFQNISENKKLHNYFETLPETTTTKLSENLRPKFKKAADKSSGENEFWKTGANTGLFILREAEHEFYGQWISNKPPFELFLIPDKGLKTSELPNEIQKLLAPYHFENLNFEDCQFLDVSNYLYCED
ncbi:hypothetical protein BH10ACI1_BH10ACI1_14290 [soil metagenome]